MVATPANGLNITTSGLVKFDGTATFSAVTTTQHDVLLGAASNGITNLAPSATVGAPLISAGAAADPAFSTSTTIADSTGLLTVNVAASLGGLNVTGSLSGSQIPIQVENTSNTANSHASMIAVVDGTSGGDAFTQWTIGSTTSYALGIDNPTANDPLKLTYAAASSVTPSSGTTLFQMTSAGVPSFPQAALGVASGGTGAQTLTGVLTGNGTSAVTGNAITQHGILIAGASNAVSTIAVASTGKVLQGNTGADPTFSTATFPSTATGTGTILRADGTNWVATTATYPATTGANTFLTSTTANAVSTDSYVPETSFTPALAFGGGTTGITYGTQVGTYQRIGNIVFFRVNIVLTSKGSSTGSATITGFPINADASGTNNPVADYQGITFTVLYTNLSIQMGSNTTATIVQIGSGQSIANIADTAFTNTAQFHFTGHYFV